MTADELLAWLDANHAEASELVVVLHKKATGVPSATWDEVVDACLAYGWIDGIRRRIDDATYSIRITPRTRTSTWSVKNLKRFDELRAEGRITAAGLAVWEAKDPAKVEQYSFEQLAMPELADDEWASFSPAGRAFFESQPRGYRKQALHWVTSAKRPETRARRLAELVGDSASGVRLRLFRR